jgi:hypothetical protein
MKGYVMQIQLNDSWTLVITAFQQWTGIFGVSTNNWTDFTFIQLDTELQSYLGRALTIGTGFMGFHINIEIYNTEERATIVEDIQKAMPELFDIPTNTDVNISPRSLEDLMESLANERSRYNTLKEFYNSNPTELVSNEFYDCHARCEELQNQILVIENGSIA